MQKKAVPLFVAIIALSSASTAYARQGSDDVQQQNMMVVSDDTQGSGGSGGQSGPGRPHPEAGDHVMSNVQITGMPVSGRQEMRQAMQPQRMELKQQIQSNREEVKKMNDDFRTETKQKIQAMRQQMKASESAQKALFKERIASFSAEKKKLTAENIDTKLATINQNRTDKMSQALSRLQEILNKLIDRTNAVKATGADTTSVETAITTAKTSLELAQKAVTTQAGKSYTADITTEQTAGSAFSTVFAKFRFELATTVGAVEAARKAVLDVAIALNKINPTVSVTPATGEEASPSAQ